MRIRSTKPEFWSSKTIAAVSWDARLVLKALESYVDDNGVGKDDIVLIISDTFRRDHFHDPMATLRRVTDCIDEIWRAGLITRYVAEGEELLYVENWKKLQRVDRPNKGRYPRPDGSMEYSENVDRSRYQGITDYAF